VRAALSRAVPFVAAIAAVVPAAAPAVEPGERTLERGDRGDGAHVSSGGLHGTQRRVHETPTMRPPGSPGGDTPLPGAQPPSPPAKPAPAGTYPIDGAHDYGEGFGDRGGEHKGQDVMADCGTPLRAVAGVTVRRVATEAAAGRYLVLHDGDSGEDYVYMHLSTVDVAAGDRVGAGEKVGEVGRTGDATACHLHFEEWTEPGWYEGGHATDPLAFLRSLTAS
jgi:murein DD-endopeptidase MepM/ murein hydrolase activator NlpD